MGAKDFPGFLRRCQNILVERKNSNEKESSMNSTPPQFTGTDLFWISSLQKSSTNREDDSAFYAKMATFSLGYRDPFLLLEDLGVFNSRVNPFIYTAKFPFDFDQKILNQAKEVVESIIDLLLIILQLSYLKKNFFFFFQGYDENKFDWSDRTDFTHLPVYTIDDPYTTETDDGISIEQKVFF